MNPFAKLAHSIVNGLRKSWDFLNQPIPEWLSELCTTIGEIVFRILSEAGQNYIRSIEKEIMNINNAYPNASGDEKFKMVWDFAHTILPEWKESDLDVLIQNLFIKLKKTSRIM